MLSSSNLRLQALRWRLWLFLTSYGDAFILACIVGAIARGYGRSGVIVIVEELREDCVSAGEDGEEEEAEGGVLVVGGKLGECSAWGDYW